MAPRARKTGRVDPTAIRNRAIRLWRVYLYIIINDYVRTTDMDADKTFLFFYNNTNVSNGPIGIILYTKYSGIFAKIQYPNKYTSTYNLIY